MLYYLGGYLKGKPSEPASSKRSDLGEVKLESEPSSAETTLCMRQWCAKVKEVAVVN